MRARIALGVLALCAGAAVCSPARGVIVLGNGETTSLAGLIASTSDHKFIVGDKLFTIESFTSSVFDPAMFVVSGYVAPNPQPLPNLGFDLMGPFGDGSPGDQVVHEMNIQYTVEIVPAILAQNPLLRIKDTSLLFNGSATGDGSYSRVDESVLDFFSGTLIGTPAVYANAGPPPTSLMQFPMTFLPGYTKLEVNKDMKFFAAHVNDTATASFVRQEFSQIPTPGALGILGIGLVVLVHRRR